LLRGSPEIGGSMCGVLRSLRHARDVPGDFGGALRCLRDISEVVVDCSSTAVAIVEEMSLTWPMMDSYPHPLLQTDASTTALIVELSRPDPCAGA
jgi:hypothetical protein